MTFSIVARDSETGELGVASQSHYFALGRVVTFARAGVGAVATQSFVEPAYGPDGLDMMAAGASAADALAKLVAADSDRGLRQVAMIDSSGATAMHTGERSVPFRGQLAGDEVVVLGNMLASEDVVPAMLAAYEASTRPFVERILDALDAAETAGGDARGQLSASLIVVGPERGARPWSDRRMDLRVDAAERPLLELRRLARLSAAHTIFGNSVFTPGLLSATTPMRRPDLDRALASLDDAAAMIGADPEPLLWKGVLLARAGNVSAARPVLRRAIAAHAPLRMFLANLRRVGILPAGLEDVSGGDGTS